MPNIVFSGLGAHLQINVTAPAAGAEVSHSNVDSSRLWITSMSFKLATDANVADRYVTLKFVVNGEFHTVVPEYGLKQTASAILYWTCSPQGYHWSGSGGGYMTLPLPNMVIIPGTFDFGTETRNLQVGDQYDEIIIWALRWLDPA